jgi:radical SAM superfamily enzyme YgiQ (UPF0313 family)
VTFPSGLAYIAAVLKNKGYTVSVIDLTLEDVNYDNLADRIRKFSPDIIGISALSYEYIQVKKLSSFLKETISCKIVLGGYIIQSYEIVLKNTGVDICVVGEGELTIVDLLENLSSLDKVRGIAYKDKEKVVLNTGREPIKDLDSIPFPAYELFDIDKYSEYLMNNIYTSQKFLPKKERHRKMTLEGSRGCPFACDFCSKIYRTSRRRSVSKVIEEIKYLKEQYDIDIFGFQDELFFFNKEEVYEFCQKIKELGVSWYAMLRVDTVDRERLKMFIDSGCLTVGFGVESGSEKILKNMNKGIIPLQIEKILKEALKIGMPLEISFILGYPGENRETIEDTINLLKRVGYPGTKFRYITPYPGSALYNRSIKDGRIANEEKYLESLGDGTGPYRFRINFTDFTDNELTDLLPETAKKIMRNYLIYLLKHPKYLFRYLMYKDFMNPVYYYYNRWFHPTNYDKAARKRKN